MQMSLHAKVRSQQRGINTEIVNLIINYGKVKWRPGGAREFVLHKKKARQLIADLKRQVNRIEKSTNKAVLVSHDDKIITIYHKK